ncbi:MAG: hypothetical protein YFSK_6480 [Candidatus Yanofskyibacterium parasiticum]|nr:MAG: hypothetical protein YFSK_6480 [Candidatus Yanofskybacteria bacterium]
MVNTTVFAPRFSITTENFGFAWLKALSNALKGKDIVFGSQKEPKYARDTVHEIVLTGGAIEEILNGKLHPKFPFKSIDQYKREFQPDFLAEYDEWPPEKKFTYLYVDRILRWKSPELKVAVNQLEDLRLQLEAQISSNIASNRSQVITWVPPIDRVSDASPCLQRIWQRPYFDKEEDVWLIDVQNDWRSRDLFNAWQPNLIALIGMLDEQIYEPLGCRIGRVIDKINSLHIYRGDIEIAEQIVKEYLPPSMRI